MPPITLLIPYLASSSFKLHNTYAALVLTYMVFTLSHAIIMMTGYFNTPPFNWTRRDSTAEALRRARRVLVLISPGTSVGVYLHAGLNEFLRTIGPRPPTCAPSPSGFNYSWASIPKSGTR